MLTTSKSAQNLRPARQPADFLSGGGEMGALIRAHDWANTPLGPPDTWPQALRTTVRLMLNTRHPMVIFWGEELSCFYNDAFRVSIGPERHPGSLGQPGREVWGEIWETIGPQIEQIMNGGESTWHENQLVPITRFGARDDAYWTYSYSPIDDADSPLGIGGILVVCAETTEMVKTRQRQAFRIEVDEALRSSPDPDALLTTVARLLGTHLDVEQCGFGQLDETGLVLAVEPGWFRGTEASLAGDYTLDALGPEITDALQNGRTVRVDNARTAPLTHPSLFTHQDGLLSGIIKPIVDEGKTVAVLFVLDTKPRNWSDDQVEPIDFVAREFWHRLEYMRGEIALRESRQELAELTASLEQEVEERTSELKASQLRLRTIFETSYQYQGVLDLNGRILEVNETSLQGIGTTLDDILGMPYWDSPWFRDTPGMADTIRTGVELVTRQGAVRQEIRLNLPTGQRWFDLTMRPMYDENRKIVGIITEAQETTQRIAAETQLRQAQKMEALGNLTGGVAHDFNNLLQVVGGNLQLLSREVEGNERAQARLENAVSGVQRGARLVSQLLSFGRRQPLTPETIAPSALLENMEELLRRALGDEVVLEFKFARDQWNTRIDIAQIENAILNLAVNARDAMGGHGHLTIATDNTTIEADQSGSQSDITAGEYVMISVSDSGTGMTDDVIKQAFDPFFTTKPVGEGTGLGLSMVWGLVKQSNGHIEIDSALGEGTTIRMFLPRSQEEVQAPREPCRAESRPGVETVLVVEDDDDVRDIIVGMLTELGYRIEETDRREHALEILSSNREIDLLLTDVIMPGQMSSTELVDAARSLIPGIGVLFVSGYTRDALDEKDRIRDGIELLEKPFKQDDLSSKIRELLDRRASDAANLLADSR